MADRKKAIKDAARAHSDLNTFGTVISILEGGHLYCQASNRAKNRIIKICQAEMQMRRRDYDDAVLDALKAAEVPA